MKFLQQLTILAWTSLIATARSQEEPNYDEPCWAVCTAPVLYEYYFCTNDNACSGCPIETACPILCDHCSDQPGNQYGGLYCDCTEVIETVPPTGAPITPAPITPAPYTQAPVLLPEEPTTIAPITPAPTTAAPIYSTPEPTTAAPITPTPVTPVPIYTAEPTTAAPITPAPITLAPITPEPTPYYTPPTTDEPSAEPTYTQSGPGPTSAAPVTSAPITRAPTTPAPTTPAPITASPYYTPPTYEPTAEPTKYTQSGPGPTVAPTTKPYKPRCVTSCGVDSGKTHVCQRTDGACALCPVEETCEKLCRRCEGKAQNFGSLNCDCDSDPASPTVAPTTANPTVAPTVMTDPPVPANEPCWAVCKDSNPPFQHFCTYDNACSGCSKTKTCANICSNCDGVPENQNGGLDCDCSEYY